MKEKSIKTNAVLNVIRQCCAILFPLITYPYLSRILGAGNLGRYSFADSVIQYIIILAELGVSTYAVREGAGLREEKKALNSFCSQVFTINMLSMLIAYAVLGILIHSVPRIRQETPIILILSVEVFAVVIGREWLNTIFEDFRYMTVRYIVIQVIIVAAILGLFFYSHERVFPGFFCQCILFAKVFSSSVNGKTEHQKAYSAYSLSILQHCSH